MRISPIALAALVTCVALSSPSQAGWTDFWHRATVDTCRNNCWPEPFNKMDQRDVRAPLDAMVRKGWQLQNTLGTYHFDPQTNQLTHAAERKIEWILTQNPPQRQVVFVQRSLDRDITSARVDAVQLSVARMLPHGELPAVVESQHAPLGRSADYIIAIHRSLEQNVTAPVLPPRETGDGG